ncbi:peptidoglycan-binding domain-containing protein [Streptomyces orinoci]|uniref:peptidoglycan-binding domain-containing protein n=1 Tax=Streptomyces orinoci TaxID=67339 RepID=UPI001F4E6272|nr:peptidoglycan-binding domain-containing protein [Streptomyces orinoci]
MSALAVTAAGAFAMAPSATAAPRALTSASTAGRQAQAVHVLALYCGYDSHNTYASRGDRGPKVKEIQCLLEKWAYDIGPSGVDGVFGADTENAVKEFQSDEGLRADGIVGPNTWRKLRYT